ncbi:MAG: PQQ-binding-like beta-propeller repeat protein [archaeon]
MYRFFLVILAFILASAVAFASLSCDQDLGFCFENYDNSSGFSSNAAVDVDSSDFTLKLTNSSGGFGPPYSTTGYVITTTIMPTSVAQWDNITFDADLPEGTNVTIQMLDSDDHVYTNVYLSGNVPGFSVSPVNISELPVEIELGIYPDNTKIARVRINITLSTTNTSVTPVFDNLTFFWVVRQGNLTASPLANTSWSTDDVDKNGTRHTLYYASPVYPAIRWVKDLGTMYSGHIVRGTDDFIYLKTSGYFDAVPSNLFCLNRTDGTTVWQKPVSGNSFSDISLSISDNGGIYISDIFHDILLAYESSDGSLRWTYQFDSGHGNQKTAIADEGSIYTVRANGVFTIYAFYPNGTVKWTNTTDPPDTISVGQVVFGDDERVYVGTTTRSGSDQSGGGKLYAYNFSDGSPLWEYATGDIKLITTIVDSDGVIYTAHSSDNVSMEKVMYAFYPNGSLKWSRNIGVADDYWVTMSLRSDGIILAERAISNGTYKMFIEAVNATDGSLLWVTENFTSIYGSEVFSDGSNGFYFITKGFNYGGSTRTNTSILYYDSDNNRKWELYQNGNYLFSYVSQDEGGNVYGSYTNMGSIAGTVFALYPWNMTVSTIPSTTFPSGSVINFTVNTTMQSTNLLNGDSNKVQVVMDSGDKVSLTYNSIDSNNDTVWVGSYILPSNTTTGTHYFTVEANAAGIQTDIPVNFDSSATNSNNTGINLTVDFTTTDGESPEITLNYPSNGLELGNATFTFNFTVTELYLDTCELWGNWSGGWHLNQSFDDFTADEIQNFSEVNLSDGRYIWNVWCNDTTANTNFSVSNYTFVFDTTAPNVSLQNPVDTESVNSNSIIFTYQVSDLTNVTPCYLYVNDTINETDSTEFIGKDTNQTFTVTLYNGDYDWYVGCGDSFSDFSNSTKFYLTVNCVENWSCTEWTTCSGGTQDRTCTDTSNCLAQANKPSESQSCGGDGGGGGGGSGGRREVVTQPKKFSLSKDEIRAELTQGETVQDSFVIKNEGDELLSLSLKIEGDLKSYTVLSKNALVLNSGEDQRIDVNFLAPVNLEPKSYVGKIIIKVGSEEKIVLMQMGVRKAEALFDVSVKVLDQYKEVFEGSEVAAEIELFNIGEVEKIDVLVDYAIRDSSGSVLANAYETVGVDTKVGFVRSLTVPKKTAPGNYTFFVNLSYNGFSVPSEDYFYVIAKVNPFIKFLRERFIELIIWVLILIVLLMIFFTLKKYLRNK